MKILVTGRNGQLGSELQELHQNNPQQQIIFVDRETMDLSDATKIRTVLSAENPEIIINAAAYTAVDKAENDQVNCDAINHLAVKTIGDWAAQNKAKVIHVSTDYVFDGNSEIPLTETDVTNPINTYGLTKLKGENALQISGADYIILRTAWVYSIYGNNFVKTMMRLMNEREEISVVTDQIGSPTYARDLAKVILQIINSSHWKNGIYNYSNEGKISWFDFAVAIKELNRFNTKINPTSSSNFITPAKRPNFSLLDKSKIKEVYEVEVPFWKESLAEMMVKL